MGRTILSGLLLATAVAATSNRARAEVYICLQYPIWQEGPNWVYFAHRHADENDCWTYDMVYYEHPTDDQFDGCFDTPQGCRPETALAMKRDLHLVNLLAPPINARKKYKLAKKLKADTGSVFPSKELGKLHGDSKLLFVRFVTFEKAANQHVYSKVFFLQVKGRKLGDKTRNTRIAMVGFEMDYDENIRFSKAKVKKTSGDFYTVEFDGMYATVAVE